MIRGQHPYRGARSPSPARRATGQSPARSMRRLEARAVEERRQAGEFPLAGIPSLTTPVADHVDAAATRDRSSRMWLGSTIGALVRRGQRRRRP